MLYYHPEYFITIVECGSITRAAEQLFVSQPYLSQYVKRLEQKLDVELFDHSTSPLQLTYTGERYYQHLVQIRKMNDNLKKEFLDIKSELTGELRLGVALWRGACLLPDVFPEFHRKYPSVRISLCEGRSSQLISALAKDSIDIAVANIPQNLDYSKYECEIICKEKILLAAPTMHPSSQKILSSCSYHGEYPIAPATILQEIPLVLTTPGQNLTIALTHAFNTHGIDPDVLLETANLTTAINLCAKGVSCVFVPEEGARVCVHPGKVTYFYIEPLNLSWELAILYKRGTYLNSITKAFISEAKMCFNNH